MMMRVLVLILLTIFLVRAGNLEQVKRFIQQSVHGEAAPHDHRLCGFASIAQVRLHYDELDAETRQMADRILNPMAAQFTIVSPDSHFTLHYDTTGANGVNPEDESGNGIPDFIDSAAAILDHVWRVEIEELGFRPPVNDAGQPVQQYDVYFKNFSNYYGQTVFGSPINDPDGIVRYSSYMELDNDFSGGFYTTGIPALKVTAAHEFNHAIQLAYNLRYNGQIQDLFLMEMTSTWMEDVVYDEVNDYIQYLEDSEGLFERFYEFRFNSTYNFDPYANCLFLHMAQALYGREIGVKIWETIPQSPAMEALDRTLKEQGSDFALEQSRYAIWLYFTGDRAIPGEYFPEAVDYPEIRLLSQSAPYDTTIGILGMQLYKIKTEYGAYYEAKVSGDQDVLWMNHLLNGIVAGNTVPISSGQRLHLKPEDEVLVVLTNPSQQNGVKYTYNLNRAPFAAGPNPLTVYKQSHQMLFTGLPSGARIHIYDILGRQVRSLAEQNDSNQIVWDLKNGLHRYVASGMYIYIAQAGPGFLTTGKLVVVR